MKKQCAAAIDVGGTSDKRDLASMEKKNVRIEDEFSFANPAVRAGGNLYINLLDIFQYIKAGLVKFNSRGVSITSLGIDTFGNGYGILDKNGKLMGIPFHYRNPLAPDIVERMEAVVPQRDIYMETGVHLLKSNVLVQLYNEVLLGAPSMAEGCRYLPFPGVLYYLLTNVEQTEQTIASVSNLMYSGAERWDRALIDRFSIPQRLFGDIAPGGSVTARLSHDVEVETDCTEATVINIAGHDTETALVAAPFLREDTLFVSIGTAIIFGTQTDRPVVNEAGYRCHFKNSRGALGRNTLCKDISGFWIVDQCLTVWRKKQPELQYGDLCMLAANSKENRTYINVNDPIFRTLPDNMVECVKDYCRRTAQPVPATIGEMAKTLFESYALQIKFSMECLEEITGQRDYRDVVALNGGVRNHVLMQMIADALQCPVTTGSEYASVLGNILLQYQARGEIGGLDQLHEIAANSSVSHRFEPRQTAKWDAAVQFMRENYLFEC